MTRTADKQLSPTLYHTAVTAYDAAGRQSSSTDALPTYDAIYVQRRWQVVKTIFADAAATQDNLQAGAAERRHGPDAADDQYQYDVQGRLTAVIAPAVIDPATNTSVNPTTQYSYV